MQAGVGRAVAPAIVADFATLGCAACACRPYVLVSSDEVEAARPLVIMSTWRACLEVVESTVKRTVGTAPRVDYTPPKTDDQIPASKHKGVWPRGHKTIF